MFAADYRILKPLLSERRAREEINSIKCLVQYLITKATYSQVIQRITHFIRSPIKVVFIFETKGAYKELDDSLFLPPKPRRNMKNFVCELLLALHCFSMSHILQSAQKILSGEFDIIQAIPNLTEGSAGTIEIDAHTIHFSTTTNFEKLPHRKVTEFVWATTMEDTVIFKLYSKLEVE